MLRIRVRDIKPTETTNKQEKTGENIKHLHLFGMKSYCFDIGIRRASESVKIVLITCKK